jgi:preprotein translocase subunit YajC
MKAILISAFLALVFFIPVKRSTAQAQELAQLALNIEKLAQFKQILADLKKGYEIVSVGYGTIKNISEGNFQLHKTFLDGLMAVSPAVKNYKKISGIIEYQVRLVEEYKTAYKHFKNTGQFSPESIAYMGRVYDQLFDESVRDLGELTNVITADRLRMNDDERMAAIDRIFSDMEDKYLFLRHFNNGASILTLQKVKTANDIEVMKSNYGIK